MGRDRLAARLADVGDVVARGQPLLVAVAPDPLADDDADVWIVGRSHQGGKPSGSHPIVGVMERDPFAAGHRQALIARVRDTDVGRQTEEDDPVITIGHRLDEGGRLVGRSIVDDDAFEWDAPLVEH